MSRKATRHAVKNLLVGPLAGSGLVEAGNIRNGRPANFYGALVVVVVYSLGTDWTYQSKAMSHRSFPVAVDIFVKYADDELSWTEEQAEDRLDDLSDLVLDVVDSNQVVTGLWGSLSLTERTQTGDTVDVNGTEYRRETIVILPK